MSFKEYRLIASRIGGRVSRRPAVDGPYQSKLARAFQPIIDLRSSELVGAESIVLSELSDDGNARDRSAMDPARSLLEVCREAQGWPEGASGPLVLSVNVSTHQIAGQELESVVSGALSESGLAPSRLALRVPAAFFAAHVESGNATFEGLRNAGVRLILDDLGSGHSALQHLLSLPLAGVKIDRSFVAGIATDRASEAIVRGIIGIADAVGITATADGIDNQGQLSNLVRLGCEFGQGPFLGEPQDAITFSMARLA